MSGTVIDLRSEQIDPYPRSKRHAGKTVQRDPAVIDLFVQQKTAYEINAGPHLIREAKGDKALALARRALKIPAHAVGLRTGDVVLGHRLRSYLWGAGVFNTRALHLEMDGIYSGLLDDPRTVPREDLLTMWKRREPTPLTDLTVESGRLALRTLLEQSLEDNMKIRYILAHRQSARMRRSDPGEALWKALAENYAIPDLGLIPFRDMKWKLGRTIPSAWGGYDKY